MLHTLLEAFVLVALVVYLFLGDLRSTIIPTLAVPVSLIGAFLFMQLLGLSINLITLYALVLAIGIVVDNAIVVVEAVHVKMHEKHLSPYKATMEVMHEISGAIVAITLVMTAVFVPVTFMTGPVGVFYRQFAITMAASIVLSGVVALTLTPVLCAMILKPLRDPKEKRGPLGRILYAFGIFLRLFDRGVEKVTGGYAAVLRRLIPRRTLTLGTIVAFSTGIYLVNIGLPPGFIPNEDQGVLYGIIQTPPGLDTRVHQRQVPRAAEDCQRDRRGHLGHLAGRLRGSDRRPRLQRWNVYHQFEALVRTQAHLAPDHRGARGKMQSNDQRASSSSSSRPRFRVSVRPVVSPCVFWIRSNSSDYKRLGEVTNTFMDALSKRKELKNLFTFFASNYPQYELVDRQRRRHAEGRVDRKGDGQPPNPHRQHLRARLRSLRPVLQGLCPGRARSSGGSPPIWETCSSKTTAGKWSPTPSFMHVKKKQGLNEITRFNVYPSAAIQGAPAAGYSSGKPSTPSRKSPPKRCLAVTASAGKASLMTRRRRGTRRFISS